MTPVDTRRMLGIIAPLLFLAGIATLAIEDVPASLGWPFALLFWAVGIGMGLGVLISLGSEARAADQQPLG